MFSMVFVLGLYKKLLQREDKKIFCRQKILMRLAQSTERHAYILFSLKN